MGELPWQTAYYTGFDQVGMTSNGKTFLLMAKYGVEVDALQMNALQWSEGGWAESKPRTGSVLSKLLYLLDEMSGNVIARLEQGNVMDVRIFD